MLPDDSPNARSPTTLVSLTMFTLNMNLSYTNEGTFNFNIGTGVGLGIFLGDSFTTIVADLTQ